MDDLVIGVKLYIFGVLFLLDICPFYWTWTYRSILTDDGITGFVLALGPIYIEVLE
jgi:hypothetical protein